MTEKKRQQKRSTSGGTKSRSSSSSSKTSAAGRKKAAEADERRIDSRVRDEIVSIILIAVGIFFIIAFQIFGGRSNRDVAVALFQRSVWICRIHTAVLFYNIRHFAVYEEDYTCRHKICSSAADHLSDDIAHQFGKVHNMKA